jgi:hypothetical protein
MSAPVGVVERIDAGKTRYWPEPRRGMGSRPEGKLGVISFVVFRSAYTMRVWLTFIFSLFAMASHAQDRPGLFFREDWAEIPPVTPITQQHVSNSELSLALHGPGRSAIRKSHHEQPADDPYYVWSGECAGNWAVSLRHRESNVDLTGMAKMRWRSKQSGFRQLRVILKLAGGTWLVSDASDGPSADWREREINIADIRWRVLDIETIAERNWAANPDLSRVEEVGFTDLMAGGGTPASSRLDWIEVYGKPAKR